MRSSPGLPETLDCTPRIPPKPPTPSTPLFPRAHAPAGHWGNFTPQIVTEAADKNSVIVSLYCMEDFATSLVIGGALDAKAFARGEEGVSDRVPGGRVFCESLHKFAGIPNAEEADERPKVFVEEIDDVMQKFNDMQKQVQILPFPFIFYFNFLKIDRRIFVKMAKFCKVLGD
jgi:hypothetical protein